MSDSADQLHRLLEAPLLVQRTGRVSRAAGGMLRATGLSVRIGQSCILRDPDRLGAEISAEVIGFDEEAAILAPLQPLRGLHASAEVEPGPAVATTLVGDGLLGRVLDAHGTPIDGLGPLAGDLRAWPVYAAPPPPLTRRAIAKPFETGVRSIDGLLTIGQGQRTGIFSAAGAGKSTLLGMIARHARSSHNVIALIGERGREIADFVREVLGPEGLARSVVVVATSDRSALERVRAPNLATAIAEAFRERGHDVLLVMDSITRYARAMRELSLANGEAPVRRGFTASVFAELPRLLERTGPSERGFITAFYTVLLEDEAESDPIGEEVRSLLDGHIYLSRAIAQTGRYPAVDIAASLSRLFERVADERQVRVALQVRDWMSKLKEIEFLQRIGEYAPGADPDIDVAIARRGAIADFLTQPPDKPSSLSETYDRLQGLAA
jgi:ATP synthase in type III secretion protein N